MTSHSDVSRMEASVSSRSGDASPHHQTEGLYFHLSIAHRGDNLQTSVDHVRYVLRVDKTEGRRDLVILHNTPDWVAAPAGYEALRDRLLQLAEENHRAEMKRRHIARGRRRMFYRMELSVGEQIEELRLMKMGTRYLTENFPLAVAIGGLHTDTPHRHIHLHLEPRQTDGYKINLGRADFYKLDERWGRIYADEFGEAKYLEHLAKKEESRRARQAFAAGLSAIERDPDLSPEEREKRVCEFRENFRWPERSRRSVERVREMERTTYETGRIRDRERAIDGREQVLERAARTYDRTIREATEISDRGERIFRAFRERGRER